MEEMGTCGKALNLLVKEIKFGSYTLNWIRLLVETLNRKLDAPESGGLRACR